MSLNEQFLRSTEASRAAVEIRLCEIIPESPKSLYDPIRSVFESPGKRIRPVLTYLASLADTKTDWLPAACAVELLHNFTLVHDDIMDNADTRRGELTLHKRYDLNTAILAGDTIIALAEESLASGEYHLSHEMCREFSFAFRCVCEGQAYDKEFETRTDVSIEEYIRMIDLKSAKMLELAVVLGALASDGENVEPMREFAHHTGIAFQIRDDLLDLVADEAALGKKIGGDILEGKRTYLFLKAMESFGSLESHDQEMLLRIQNRNATEDDIHHAKKLFTHIGVVAKAEEAIEQETATARKSVENIRSSEVRKGLMSFSEYLLTRNF